LGPQRRGGGVPACGPPDRGRALHLPRQRRHIHAVERHRPARLPQPGGARGGDPDHPPCGAILAHHPLRRGHDAGQEALPPAVVSRARDRWRHPVAGRVRHDAGPARRGHARGVLARGGRPGRRGGAGHAAPGRGLLAARGLLRAHAGHAPGVQQRLHEHAPRRAQRRLSPAHQEHPRVRPADPQALRQLHVQPGRAHRHRSVRT